MSDPEFLTLDEVLSIHADQLRRYGGAGGVRDVSRLISAIGMAETSFDGEYLHTTVFEMAAACLFHLAKNHPFVAGNKRTALMCALVFLGLSGQQLFAQANELNGWVDGVAAGRVDKSEVAVFLRENSRAR